jgi:hypothetical protein
MVKAMKQQKAADGEEQAVSAQAAFATAEQTHDQVNISAPEHQRLVGCRM